MIGVGFFIGIFWTIYFVFDSGTDNDGTIDDDGGGICNLFHTGHSDIGRWYFLSFCL